MLSNEHTEIKGKFLLYKKFVVQGSGAQSVVFELAASASPENLLGKQIKPTLKASPAICFNKPSR